MKKFFDELTDEHRQSVPSDFMRMSELEILALWTPNPKDPKTATGLPGNPVTAMFLSDGFRADFLKDRRAAEVAAAAACIGILNHFLYVGDFACFETSIQNLSIRLRAFGVPACEHRSVPKERVSQERRGNLDWLEKGRKIVDSYLDSQVVDGMVYRHYSQWRRHYE